MSKMEEIKTDPSVGMSARPDPAFVYSNSINHSVDRILIPDAIKELMCLFTGEALKSLCPERSERCDEKDPCDEYSCDYSRFIFERVLTNAHEDFDAKLRSFFETHVRRIYEQIPFLVDYQIRTTAKKSDQDR